MAFKDMREFIVRLEKEGEAQRINDEMDWNLEVGAMLRRSNEARLPAPFFQKVKDYPGHRIFGSPLSNHRRIAIAMGIDPNITVKELIEEYLKKSKQAIKPIVVKDGPCKENIVLGDKVDLFAFPVPFVHEGDGGRFIGTWHVDIAKDLNTGWVNWGMHRHMVHNKNTIGIESSPHTHIGQVFTQQYEPRKQTMEIAIVIGAEPVSHFCAASPIPFGVSEVEVVGAMRGEPLDLIKCETVDLFVPATAEIVIEGEMRPGERMVEGPFGEYTGYSVSRVRPAPVVHVRAITYRNDPILTMTCVGMPVDESAANKEIAFAGSFLEALRTRGLPVTAVSMPPELCGMLSVVAVKKSSENIASEVAHVVWATQKGRIIPMVIVVDSNVDVFNIAEVFHALATKCHPFKGIVRLEHEVGSIYQPWANEYEQKYRIGAKAYFDCTWPLEWDPKDVPQRTSFLESYPAEIQQKVLDTWRKYGY
jgi:4-hydroxy-3-polyprenylbenzoate decarboxylase